MELQLIIAYAIFFIIVTLLFFWLIKRKQHLRYLLIGIPILCIIAFACTYIPHNVVNIDHSMISKITIFDGNSGDYFEITDGADIKHIINNLNEATFQKGKPSIGYMGYRFNTKIFDQEGDLIKELIINSDETIRYNWFFYNTVDSTLAYDYIDKLIRE
ncbi:hypothetical protein [Paucisalibacillus sp. EB02]|uniref:hypothetical protein n=1 Tax=Paucisalibacillus sp. EB02 TaxID=1347087 RepID=UPI001E3C738A|nr:hypothetical protein [Paucisalibacillus sp. EB02]